MVSIRTGDSEDTSTWNERQVPLPFSCDIINSETIKQLRLFIITIRQCQKATSNTTKTKKSLVLSRLDWFRQIVLNRHSRLSREVWKKKLIRHRIIKLIHNVNELVRTGQQISRDQINDHHTIVPQKCFSLSGQTESIIICEHWTAHIVVEIKNRLFWLLLL